VNIIGAVIYSDVRSTQVRQCTPVGLESLFWGLVLVLGLKHQDSELDSRSSRLGLNNLTVSSKKRFHGIFVRVVMVSADYYHVTSVFFRTRSLLRQLLIPDLVYLDLC